MMLMQCASQHPTDDTNANVGTALSNVARMLSQASIGANERDDDGDDLDSTNNNNNGRISNFEDNQI